ncbi:MAG TPA: LysR family transcriptional regulator [Pseudolabrys sp.]|nr:LysR family transcriptional regulator [Pseudolabrys sp.]
MEMQQIRYFLAVAKTLNFTKAAQECNIAQPSLSRAIKSLEDELGGALFRRERSLSHLTELGRLMLPLLTQSHESAIAAKSLALSYKKGVTAPLRLALSHTINLALLVPALTELVRVFPGLELQFFRGDGAGILERLKSGDAELALAGPLDVSWERLDRALLFRENYQLVVNKSHALARRNRIGIGDLKEQRLICRGYCEQAAELAAALEASGIKQVSSPGLLADEDLLSLIEANLGVAIMPQTARGGRSLHGIAVDELAIERAVFLYSVAGRERSPAASGLTKLLRAADWSGTLPPGRFDAAHAQSAARPS